MNTSRSPQEHLGEKFIEHVKAPSPMDDHYNITGHTTSIENFSIVGEGGPEPH